MDNQPTNGSLGISASPQLEQAASPALQQSPISYSMSVSNSNVTSIAGSPVSAAIPHMSPSTNGTILEPVTNSALHSDSMLNGTIVPNLKAETDASNLMDVDAPTEYTEPQLIQPIQPEALSEDFEQQRLKKLEEIDKILDSMDSTRLELVPLLLDVIEQVRNGEIPIKDVDNISGRIRLRLNKLGEDRTLVESELEKINQQFRCSADENESTQRRIAIKQECISDVIDSIKKFRSK